ncbi:snoRNA biogenesis protein [Schizosaccharomyces cryophilus OY26]|uniref:SnoRNA biogenesis protein n=1 Tax=Schizosaccharomyces cryophilus (strain OY26 / ATCC MYA-4695 / CBS 11777 / NBRC 106824 / NRRL Y48691) TaxID=653667 RepID=S9W0L7_SCHCR|nr:snoRNA biogenesis protein [Schizosaccharomyces cryophilus OY26]EPY51600.1 snoRNA biogenesis protein [Schizosaccharomyces cryophilus OY26]
MSEGRSKICSVCRTNCSGKRDPTKFIPKNQLVSHLNSDYNFLSGLEKVIEKKEKDETTSIHRADRNRAQLKRTIEKTGINIHLAPASTKKRKDNKTHFDRKRRHVVWTIEWQLHDTSIQGSPIAVCLTHHNSEMNSIDKLWDSFLQEQKDKLSVDLSKFQLENHPQWVMKARRSVSRGDVYKRIPPFIPLSSVLQQIEIFEFPTVHVLPSDASVITLSDYETSSEEEEEEEEEGSESSDSESSSDNNDKESNGETSDSASSDGESSRSPKQTPIPTLDDSSNKEKKKDSQSNAPDARSADVLDSNKAELNIIEDSLSLPPLFGSFFQKKD